MFISSLLDFFNDLFLHNKIYNFKKVLYIGYLILMYNIFLLKMYYFLKWFQNWAI